MAPIPAVVVAGGGALHPAAAGAARSAASAGWVVIAVDGGAGAALEAGLRPAHLVGDLDSVDSAVAASVEAGGAEVHRFPVDKDETDLELGLALAVSLGAPRVLVVGAWGDRLDHLLAEVALLASPRWTGVEVEARLGQAVIHVVRSSITFPGAHGELVTLLAPDGPATGLHTTGLRFPLRGEALGPGTTRGVSNELVDEEATVRVGSGVLLVVRPGVGSG